MADQEKNKRMQIDDMLNSLLANYSSAEPRPGLETRILANLQEAAGNEIACGDGGILNGFGRERLRP